MARLWLPLVLVAGLSAAPAQAQYPFSVGGPSFDAAYNVDYAPDGTAYVTGTFRGTADFNGTTLVSSGGTDGFLVAFDPSGVPLWALRFGSPDGGDAGNDVVYNAGLVHVTGFVAPGADFDGTLLPALGGSDILLATVDVTSGAPVTVWAETLGSPANDVGEDLTLTPYDDPGAPARPGLDLSASKTPVLFAPTVFVIGSFRRTGEFNPLGPSFTLTSNGNNDAFIAGYGSLSGVLYDAINIGGRNRDSGFGIDYCPITDRIWSTGAFRGTARFNPNGALVTMTSAGGEDAWVASYDFSSPPALSDVVFPIAGPSTDRGYDIAARPSSVEPTGQVYVTGLFAQTADFNSTLVTAAGSVDGFVAAFNKFTGDNTWVNRIASTAVDAGLAIDLDDCENVYASGLFSRDARFESTGPSPPDTHTSDGDWDAWTASWSASGDLRVANRLGGINRDIGWGVSADRISGEHLSVGEFRRDASMTSGGAPSATILTSTGDADGWIAAYTVNGLLTSTLCVCPPSALEVWHDFDAWVPGGSDVLDITFPFTPPNDGAPTGGVTAIPGAVDTGGFFSSVDFLSTPAALELELGTRDLTIDAWVKVYTGMASGPVTIASKWLTTAAGDEIGYEFTLVPVSPGMWDLELTLSDGATFFPFSSTAVPIPPDEWRFVAVRAERSAAGTLVTFYFHGAVVGSLPGPAFASIVNPPAPLRVHASGFVPAAQERAGLDEIEVTFSALSDTVLDGIFRYGKCKPCLWAQFQPPHGGPPDIGTNEPILPDAALETAVLSLETPFPNPARSAATVAYTLDRERAVRVEVLDVTGRIVGVLADGRQPTGRHETVLDARTLPPGVYLIRLVTEGETLTRRLTLLR